MIEKQSIKAEIIADSIERIGNNRITSWQLTYPRFIHSELMTHRILSKNSASSRAIPFNKMVEQVENDPFIPIKWMKEHKGMQGSDYFNNLDTKYTEDLPYVTSEGNKQHYILPLLEKEWLIARDKAVNQAKLLDGIGLTKQICNRILEPFLWHTIILTGTEFENFFALRAHPMAEIHLQDLAYKMLEVYNASTPKELKAGEWHIPFENNIDLQDWYNDNKRPTAAFWNELEGYEQDSWSIKISTAKCAQISYMKFGSDDYEDLLDLHDSLLLRPYEGKRGIRTIEDPIHASPASHCAQAMTEEEYWTHFKGKLNDFNKSINHKEENNEDFRHGWCHNLKGFKSYRSMLPNENSTDSRVIKK